MSPSELSDHLRQARHTMTNLGNMASKRDADYLKRTLLIATLKLYDAWLDTLSMNPTIIYIGQTVVNLSSKLNTENAISVDDAVNEFNTLYDEMNPG
eukprot:141876_1